MKKSIIVMLAACTLCLALASCQKENSGRAPRIPSVETIKIDLSSIPATKAGTPSDAFAGVVDMVNNFWCNIYEQIINIPLKCLEIVAEAQPEQDGRVWTWRVTDYNYLGQKYEVVLTGREHGNKVDWELSVSRDGFGGYQNYTWITGWSKKDGSEGQWFVNVSPNDMDLLVTSDWTAKDGTVQDCKLTYNLEHALGTWAAFFNGSYIEYINGASDNAYTSTLIVSYFQIGNISVDATVEWNYRTGACRYKIGESGNWIEYSNQ